MPDQKKILFDRDTLLMYKNSQAGVPNDYDPNSFQGGSYKIIEEQSAVFLADYAEGKVVVNDADLDVLKDFLKCLRLSSYVAIKENLPKAEKKFKLATILLHKKEEEEKSKRKKSVSSENKNDTSEDIVNYISALLQKKKELVKLSSTDLLRLSELLDKVKSAKSIRKASVLRIENQLNSYIETRIDRIFKEELDKDENFELLVQKRGSFRQKEKLERKSSSTNSSTQQQDSSVVTASVENEQGAVLQPVVSQAASVVPDNTVEKQETVSQPVNSQASPEASDSSDVAPKASKDSKTFNFPHDIDRMEFLKRNQFAILQNKKEAQKLSAIDYLLIAEMIKDEKGYSTKDISDKLRSYAQLRINNVLSGKLPYEPGFDLLVSTQGTSTQYVNFDRRKSVLMGAAALDQASDDSQDGKQDKKEPIDQKSTAARDQGSDDSQDGKQDKKEPIAQNEEKDDVAPAVPLKMPWYKKWWRLAAAAVVGAVAIFGLAKAPNFFKNGSKDKVSPQTEQNDKTLNNYRTNTETSSSDNKSADFNALRQKIEEKKAQISASSATAVAEAHSSTPAVTQAATVTPVSTDKVTNAPTNELDDDWNKRVDIFKKAQDKLHINLDNLDKVVNDQVKVGNIVLSEKLTEARAKYMISFYAQYPYSEAGRVCNALLNGEEVKVSKDDFNKWNDELGDRGTEFINTLKKNGYTTTTFSPSDYVYYTTTTRDV